MVTALRDTWDRNPGRIRRIDDCFEVLPVPLATGAALDGPGLGLLQFHALQSFESWSMFILQALFPVKPDLAKQIHQQNPFMMRTPLFSPAVRLELLSVSLSSRCNA